MGRQAQKLRELFAAGEHFFAAEAYSALTGRIVERVGFKAAYLGGHACSAFHYAIPDNGVFSQLEQIDQCGRIAEAMDIPLIADADTLGETVADAYHLTKKYERAGIAGFHVEDEVNPKHSAAYAGGLIPTIEMQARIEACTRAREDPAFFVIARCDELYVQAKGGGGGGSEEEAIARGRAYAEAGADALFYPTMTAEQVEPFKAALPVPIVDMGFRIPGTAATLSTGWGWVGAARAHYQIARELMETGSFTMAGGLDDKDALIRQDEYDAVIAGWAEKTGRKAR